MSRSWLRLAGPHFALAFTVGAVQAAVVALWRVR